MSIAAGPAIRDLSRLLPPTGLLPPALPPAAWAPPSRDREPAGNSTSPPLRTEQAILEDRRRDDSFAKPRFSCYGIWCFTSRRRTIIVSFRGDVRPLNAGRTALSPYAVDVAGQHLTERFSPWRTLLHPRGKHSRAPTTTFARPAQPLLARLLGRRPSFVDSSSCIPPTHPSLPVPPIAHGAGDPRRPPMIHGRPVLGRVLELLGIWLVNGWLTNKGGRSALRASMVIFF